MSADQNTDAGHSGPKQPRPKHSGAQTDVSPEATSKSARKREADRLLLLGRRLTELRHEHLDTLAGCTAPSTPRLPTISKPRGKKATAAIHWQNHAQHRR